MPELMFKPRIDVSDNGEYFEVTVELPDIEINDVQIILKNGILTVSGQKYPRKRNSNSNLYINERNYGLFGRSVSLAIPLDQTAFDVSLDRGVLKVIIAKSVGHPTQLKARIRRHRGFFRRFVRSRKSTKSHPYYED
jgi:HSP20 family protein